MDVPRWRLPTVQRPRSERLQDMNSENPIRVRLTGGLEHTSSSVEVRPDGSLVVEFYDFSDEAERTFGNDVAYVLLVEPEQKTRILSGLLTESQDEEAQMNPDAQLLHLMQQKFRSYFEVKEWLEGQGITFRSEFDPQA